MKRIWVLLFLFLMGCVSGVQAFEAKTNLSGRVLEKGTRQPVVGAMIVASFENADTTAVDFPWSQYFEMIGNLPGQFQEKRTLVTFADSTGSFGFSSLPPGEIKLNFPNMGYLPLEVSEVVEKGVLAGQVYWLERTQYNEYEMVVSARGPEKEISRQSLSVNEVQSLPGFGGDVIKSLQALPGVARSTMNDPGAIVVRGSGNYDTRFFLDGVDIPLLFHFGGVKSTYNSLSLGNVDLYPGGFGTRYGGCVGGVVELKGRRSRQDRWHTVLDASLLDASFHTEGPLGKNFGLTVGARRSFIGELASAALKNNEDINLVVAPYYWDSIARLDWNKGRDHRLFLTFFASSDHMRIISPGNDSGSPTVSEANDEVALDLTFKRFILGYDAKLSDRVQNELRLSAGKDSNSGHALGFFRFRFEGPVYNLRNDLALTWSPDLIAHVGADILHSEVDYAVKIVGYPESKLGDNSFSDLGTYTNVEWRPHPNLLITPGIRHDYYTRLKKGKVSFRGSARWDYHEDRTITASAGTYNQSPRPLGHSTDYIYGNPDLPITTARHLTIGHEWRLGDRLSLKVEGYRNTQDLIPAFADTANLNFLPDADAQMYGLEFMLRHESDGQFFGWVSYSIGRSNRRFERNPGAGPNWDPNSWYLHEIDQTHHLEAVGSWQLGRNWSFGSRLQFVSGVPMTPILGFTGNQYEFDSDTGNYVPVEGEYNSERVDPYFRSDFRVEKKFIKRSSVWSLYLDLQNANYFIYNSPEGYTYNYDYSKRDSYGWIFVPALGMRVEF